MDAEQLPDHLRSLIHKQVAAGRADSAAEFLAQAVQRYADELEQIEADILAAADEGIADMQAGRFDVVAGPDDEARLRADLRATRTDAGRQGRPATVGSHFD